MKVRHPLFARVFHWINFVCFTILVMSGFQIFNVHPRLYLGNTGNYHEAAIFEVGGNSDPAKPESWVAFGDHRIDSTGVVGQPLEHVFFGTMHIAYPDWMTLSDPGDMGHARGYHFLAIVPFIANFLVYAVLSLTSGHLRRNIAPVTRGPFWREVAREIVKHARLGNWREGVAAQSNILQKMAYSTVLLVFFPLMILTGLTMSPAYLARLPWLIDLFHGRQTARTVHFILANALLLFVIIHVAQVLIVGPIVSIRAMITGGRLRNRGEETA